MSIFKITSQYGEPKLIVHERDHATLAARIALNLAERWGMIAAVPDGEDSSGRSKLRTMTPEEITDRACNTAESLLVEIKNRGWIAEAPSWEEMEEESKRLEAEKRKR